MTTSIFLFTAGLVILVGTLSFLFFRFVIPALGGSLNGDDNTTIKAEDAAKSWNNKSDTPLFLLDSRVWLLKAVPIGAVVFLFALVPCLSYLAEADPASAEYFHRRTMLIQRLLAGDHSKESIETQAKLAYHYEKKGQIEEALREYLVAIDRLETGRAESDKSNLIDLTRNDRQLVDLREHAAALAEKHEHYMIAADLYEGLAKIYLPYKRTFERHYSNNLPKHYLIAMLSAGDMAMKDNRISQANDLYQTGLSQALKDPTLQNPYDINQIDELTDTENDRSKLNDRAIRSLRRQARALIILGQSEKARLADANADVLVKQWLYSKIMPELDKKWKHLARHKPVPYQVLVNAQIRSSGQNCHPEIAVGSGDAYLDKLAARVVNNVVGKLSLSDLREYSSYGVPLLISMHYGYSQGQVNFAAGVEPYQKETPYSFLRLQ